MMSKDTMEIELRASWKHGNEEYRRIHTTNPCQEGKIAIVDRATVQNQKAVTEQPDQVNPH